jgi:hypothetical protein
LKEHSAMIASCVHLAQVCDLWVHFSCDPRAQQGLLGSFREYAVADGRAFTCIACTEVKKKSRKER